MRYAAACFTPRNLTSLAAAYAHLRSFGLAEEEYHPPGLLPQRGGRGIKADMAKMQQVADALRANCLLRQVVEGRGGAAPALL